MRVDPHLHSPQSDHPALPAIVDELLDVTSEIVTPNARHSLERAHERLAENRLNLVFLGEFKRGKSTLINRLLGREILPTGVVPLTSCVTLIRWGGADRLLVRFGGGDEHPHPLDSLGDFVTEPGNPHNRKGVEVAVVELDHDLLAGGLQLVDTPGIGSIYAHNTAVAREFIPQVDAAVFVLTADQPVTEAEHELIAETARRVPRLFFAVNKIDHLVEQERSDGVQFIRAAIMQSFHEGEPDLFAVSARSGAGLSELRARLEAFSSTERNETLTRSVRRLAGGYAQEAVEAVRFEAHAIELPLSELERRARVFEERIGSLLSAREEAADLLVQGVSRLLLEQVDDPLQRYASVEATNLGARLGRRAADLDGASPRALARELESWTDEEVRVLFTSLASHLEAEIADELAGLERRYAERVEAILADLARLSEDVFGAYAGGHLLDGGLDAPSRFTFKLADEQQALEQLAAFGRTIVPGPLGRRLVLREAEQRLLQMADRHAGRLRSDLNDRVWESVRSYERKLGLLVGEAVQAIRDAVERAAHEHRSGRRHARGRLAELARLEARLLELAAHLVSGEREPAPV